MPRRRNSWSTGSGGSSKIATVGAKPWWKRSAASSTPAPSESTDTTMRSERRSSPLCASISPAERRTASRVAGMAPAASKEMPISPSTIQIALAARSRRLRETGLLLLGAPRGEGSAEPGNLSTELLLLCHTVRITGARRCDTNCPAPLPYHGIISRTLPEQLHRAFSRARPFLMWA